MADKKKKTLKEATRINFLNQQERRERKKFGKLYAEGKCTCHLLSPFGHVVCRECNQFLGGGGSDNDYFAREMGLSLL
jgi:hypothetical protein